MIHKFELQFIMKYIIIGKKVKLFNEKHLFTKRIHMIKESEKICK